MVWLENTHEMVMLQSWPEVFVDRSSCWRQVFHLNSNRLSQYFHGISLTLTLTVHLTSLQICSSILQNFHLPGEQFCWHKTCRGCHEFAFFLPRLKHQVARRSKCWKLLEIPKIVVEILKLLNLYKNSAYHQRCTGGLTNICVPMIMSKEKANISTTN